MAIPARRIETAIQFVRDPRDLVGFIENTRGGMPGQR
jgi:hypothetical protein